MRKIALCVLTGAIFNSIHAQEKNNELDPVTITASVAPEKASQTGRDLFVIKGERFANLPIHSIDELLRYLPGMEVQARGPMGSQSDFVLRGGTFQQVLVILDGLRLNDPNSGHFTSYIPIAPTEIDRIEILKGASSAIYGSEAVGGVIHIITKTFAARKGASGINGTAGSLRRLGAQDKTMYRSNALLQISGGQYDFWNLNAGGFFDNGKTSVAAGFLSNNTKGQPQRGIRGYVNSNTASFSFSHHLGQRWELKMRYAYDDRKFAAQNFYTTFVSDTSEEKLASFWSHVAIAYNAKKDRITLQFGYKDLDDEFKFNSISLPNKNNSKLFQVLATNEWRWKEGTMITSGVQLLSKRIVSNDRGDHQVDQAAAFAVLNQQLGKLFLSPAARIEYNERYGWEFVPQINLSYKTSKLQVRGSAGKTIRDADFTERYNNYKKPFVSSGRIGNPDLEAEHSFSYETGADYFWMNTLKLSATWFQRFHKGLIDYVPTAYNDMPRKVNLTPAGSYALAKNISSVNTNGFETEAQFSKQLKKGQQVWITMGMTWLKSASSSATPSFYVSSHARFLENFNLFYSSQRFSVALNGIYKKRDPQTTTANIAKVSEDYFVMNAKAEVFVVKKLLSVFVQADNLFDTNYADLLGAQMPGRWIMGGVKVAFAK